MSEGLPSSLFSHVDFLDAFVSVLASKMNLKWGASWGYEHCTFLTGGPLGALWDAQGGSFAQFQRFWNAQGGFVAQFHRFRLQISRVFATCMANGLTFSDCHSLRTPICMILSYEFPECMPTVNKKVGGIREASIYIKFSLAWLAVNTAARPGFVTPRSS